MDLDLKEEVEKIKGEHAPVNFYRPAGIVVAAFGVIVGFYLELYTLILAVPLGIIIMVLGDILSQFRRRIK